MGNPRNFDWLFHWKLFLALYSHSTRASAAKRDLVLTFKKNKQTAKSRLQPRQTRNFVWLNAMLGTSFIIKNFRSHQLLNKLVTLLV